MESIQLEFKFDPEFNNKLTNIELRLLKISHDKTRRRLFAEIEQLTKMIKNLTNEVNSLKKAA